MKIINKLKWMASILGLVSAAVWMTGCRDTGGENGTGGGGGSTNAPVALGGKSLTHTISSGTAPFSSSGTFVLRAGGVAGDRTGSYTITGSGGVTNSTGTYTYSMTDTNAATLLLQDSLVGAVNESLVFQSSGTGTFSRTAGGGSQTGTFFLQ